jgi:hypothetical protein
MGHGLGRRSDDEQASEQAGADVDGQQCIDPVRRIGLVTNDTSAVCPEVPITAAKQR